MTRVGYHLVLEMRSQSMAARIVELKHKLVEAELRIGQYILFSTRAAAILAKSRSELNQ